jgi:prophage tail gpP-like protein
VIGEEQSDRASLQMRATWEMTVRAARSQRATLSIAGWRNRAGALFAANTIAAMDDEKLSIKGPMLIEAVELTYDESAGTVAKLTLVPPEAWSQLAVPEDREAGRVR